MEPLSILYITLAVCIGILTIVTAVAIIQMSLLMRDARVVTKHAANLVEKVDGFISKPFLLIKNALEVIMPFVQNVREHLKKKKGRSKGSEE